MAERSPERPWKGRSLHFIGIGGAGMSGLALVAHTLGAEVSGSDAARSTYTERLAAAGIEAAIGHDQANLPKGAEVVVSTAIADANPELARAKAERAPVLHRGELLAELAAMRRSIAVAGTHGKTTTTAMVAHCLALAGLDPSFLVGGEVRLPDGGRSNAHWGEGEWIVVEADESDASFLRLEPQVAAVTNVELDHPSTYLSALAVERVFAEFLERLVPSGSAVLWDRPELLRLAPEGRERLCFDAEPRRPDRATSDEPPDLLATAVELRPLGAGFTLRRDGEEVGPVELSVPGFHNVLNAMACLGCCDRVGLDLADAGAALASFAGVARRFEPKGTAFGAVIYDDYAHHPTEIRATLETARNLGARRVVVVFQPHLYSRTLALQRDFGRALALADEVLVLDVYAAREEALGPFAEVSGKLVADAVADQCDGRRVVWLPDSEQALAYLAADLREGDVVLTIGAGDITRLGERLVERGAA